MAVLAAAMAAAPMRPLITLRSHRGQIFPTSSAPVVLVVAGTQVVILHLIRLSLWLMEPPALRVVPLREVLVTLATLAVMGLAVMVVVVVRLVLMVLEVMALAALVVRGTLVPVVLVVRRVILVSPMPKVAGVAEVAVALLALVERLHQEIRGLGFDLHVHVPSPLIDRRSGGASIPAVVGPVLAACPLG